MPACSDVSVSATASMHVSSMLSESLTVLPESTEKTAWHVALAQASARRRSSILYRRRTWSMFCAHPQTRARLHARTVTTHASDACSAQQSAISTRSMLRTISPRSIQLSASPADSALLYARPERSTASRSFLQRNRLRR